MPVILSERDYDRWLERDAQERPPLDLLRPYPAEEMEAHQAHRGVGSVRNNSSDLLNSR